MPDKKLVSLTPAIERKRFLAEEHNAVQHAIEGFAVDYARGLVAKLGQVNNHNILQELGAVLRYCPTWFENIANPLRNSDGSYPHQLVSNLYRHKLLESKLVEFRETAVRPTFANTTLDTIRYHSAQMARCMDEAEEAIIKRGSPIFMFNNAPYRIEVSNGLPGEGLQVALKEVTTEMLYDHLLRDMNWERWDEDQKCYVACKPPESLARLMRQRGSALRFRKLRAVVRCPYIRLDTGEIISTTGYDEVTGNYLVTDVELTTPPDGEGGFEDWSHPTKETALKALGILRSLFRETAYADPIPEGKITSVSESALLAGVATNVLRPLFPVVPGWAISAPEGGSGKSAPQEAAGIIANGRKSAAIAAGRDPNEFEKRLVGAILSGDTEVFIDNCNQVVEGEFLAQITSQEYLKPRGLGSSKMPVLQNTVQVKINGNQIQIAGEQKRRYIITYILAKGMNPFSGKHEVKLFEAAKRGRGLYLNCILTLVRAFILSGEADKVSKTLEPFETFESWSDILRCAFVWLGCADPVANTELMDSDDDEELMVLALLKSWPGVYVERSVIVQKKGVEGEASHRTDYSGNGAGVGADVGADGRIGTVVEIVSEIALNKGESTEPVITSDLISKRYSSFGLNAALESIAGIRGGLGGALNIDGKRLGYFIKNVMRGKERVGLMVVPAGQKHHQNAYKVKRVK